MKLIGKNKLLVFMILLITLLLISACGSESSSSNGNNDPSNDTTQDSSNDNNGSDNQDEEEYVIGLAMIDLNHPFFVRMQEAGQQAGEDYGVRTIWQSADGSLERQISIIENYIQQGVDVILIDPLDNNAVVPVIQEAKAAGIPVITMGNKVEGDWNHNTLYPDYENMAMVARAIGTALGGEGQVALLTGAAGNYVSDTREEGFMNTIESEFPNIEVVGVQPTNFDPARAQTVAETWLNNYLDLDAIAFISDPLGLAAISVAQSQGKDLIYGGYDGDKEMEAFLDNGSMVIDVLTGAYRVGYWNVAAGARIAKGTEFPTDLFMPTHFITTDETAQLLRENGLEFDYITPEEAYKLATDYSDEMGPHQPDERISGQ